MNNTNIPNWARKPHHPKKVVATKQGWVVEETGEVLVRVRNLDEKLAEYLGVQSVTFENGMVVASGPVIAPEATQPLVTENQVNIMPLEGSLAPVADATVVVETLPTAKEEMTLEKPNTGEIAEVSTEPVKRKPGRPRKEHKDA